MKYFDENNKSVNLDALKNDLMDLQDVEVPTESELENDLQAAYQQGNTMITGMSDIDFSGIGKKILKKIKQAVCSIVGPSSSSEDIVDAILDALIALLPGGVLLKPLAKKLAKYIFDKGIGAFCAVA